MSRCGRAHAGGAVARNKADDGRLVGGGGPISRMCTNLVAGRASSGGAVATREVGGDDVAEGRWDASGAHVRKRPRLKKKGSMKREASMSTRTVLLVPSRTYPISPSDSQSQCLVWR